jgi:putative ABC transport system permease protein
MRSLTLASLAHYRGLNALVVAGIAVAVAVLAGALLVGASVRASLRELALARLGNTDLVVSSTSYFRAALADELRAPEIAGVAPLVAVQGAVTHEDSRRSAARVQVFGIDERFLAFHGLPAAAPQGRDVWMSEALAAELGARAGDGIVLRVAKPTDIPLSHLQGRREDTSERLRLTATRVLDREALGEFSLVPAQGPAYSLFVPLARLQQDLEIRDSANALLVRMTAALRDPLAAVRAALAPIVTLEDLGLKVRTTETHTILESRTGLLQDEIWRAAARRAADRGGTPTGVLTYLANSIRANGREIPYSLIAAMDLAASEVEASSAEDGGAKALPSAPPIHLNEWAAQDLGVTIGDQITVDYYLWSDQDGLLTRSAAFSFAGIVPMSGVGGDQTLTPEYPGITDAADVTSWDPPFPIDMQRVRKKDEEYWDRWRSAPKAFIPLAEGQRLWASPFGTLSSLRTPSIEGWPSVPPIDASLTIRDARAEALAAAHGTTDFGEYFVYFSFFLVVSGLLLAGMFFALSVEQRARELGVLFAVGYRQRDVRRLLLREAAVLAGIGSLIGMAGAIGYAWLIMYGLRTWWVGAVNTTSLELHVDPLWLIAGAAGALVSAVVALALAMRRIARQSPIARRRESRRCDAKWHDRAEARSRCFEPEAGGSFLGARLQPGQSHCSECITDRSIARRCRHAGPRSCRRRVLRRRQSPDDCRLRRVCCLAATAAVIRPAAIGSAIWRVVRALAADAQCVVGSAHRLCVFRHCGRRRVPPRCGRPLARTGLGHRRVRADG